MCSNTFALQENTVIQHGYKSNTFCIKCSEEKSFYTDLSLKPVVAADGLKAFVGVIKPVRSHYTVPDF